MSSNKVDAVHQQVYRDGDLKIWISPLAAPMHRVFPVDALCFMASSSGLGFHGILYPHFHAVFVPISEQLRLESLRPTIQPQQPISATPPRKMWTNYKQRERWQEPTA